MNLNNAWRNWLQTNILQGVEITRLVGLPSVLSHFSSKGRVPPHTRRLDPIPYPVSVTSRRAFPEPGAGAYSCIPTVRLRSPHPPPDTKTLQHNPTLPFLVSILIGCDGFSLSNASMLEVEDEAQASPQSNRNHLVCPRCMSNSICFTARTRSRRWSGPLPSLGL